MLKFKRPGKPVCALCGVDDRVETSYLGEGIWEHSCAGSSHAKPRVWQESVAAGIDELALEGLTLEWGLYDDLPKCLTPGEPLVEYGIVEHRYKELNPVRYRLLVDRYSHTSLGPSRYTASSFIASALGRLWRRGDLEATFGPATGYWAYNGTISYWALPQPNPGGQTITWESFAGEKGMEPGIWTIT